MKWRWVILFLFSFLWAEQKVKILSDFSGGLNTKVAPALIRENQTPDCLNVLFDEIGGVKTRDGYVYEGYPSTTTIGQKLFYYQKASGEKFYIVQIQDKLYYSPDMEDWTLIKSDIKWQLNELNATVVNDKIFFTNGIDTVFSFDGTDIDEYSFIPKGKIITSNSDASSGVIYDRVFVANTYDYPSGVYWTDTAYLPDEEDAWSETQLFFVGLNDGDVITGLYVWRGDLYVFKKNSVWKVMNTSPESGALIKLTSEYGCVAQSTIDEYKNRLIFLSNKGVILFDGSFFTEVSLPIEPDIENWNNLKGEIYYWINTKTSDFNAGTLTNVDTSFNEIKLEDKTKIWDSSETFCAGTLNDVDTSGEYIVLASTPLSYAKENIGLISNHYVKMTGSKNAWGWLYDSLVGPYANNGDDYYLRNNVGDGEWWSLLANAYDTGSDYEETGAYKMSGSDYVYPQVCGGDINYKHDQTSYFFSVVSKYGFTLAPISQDKIIKKVDVKADISFPTSIYFDAYYIKSDFADSHTNDEIGIKVYLKSTIHFVDGGSSDYVKYLGKSYITVSQLQTDYYRVRYKSYNTTIEKTYSGNEFSINVNTENEEVQKIDLVIYAQMYDETDVENTYDFEFYSLNSFPITKLYDISLYYPTTDTVYQSTGTWISEVHNFGKEVYLSTFTVDSFIPESSSITFQAKSSASDWVDISTNTLLPSSLSPCTTIQIKASFSTNYSTQTPILRSVSVGAIASTGTWVSKKFNANKVSSWKYFIADDNGKQTRDYYVKFATSSTALDNASWQAVNSGDSLTSTYTYIQTKVELETNKGNENPTVRSLTFTWYPETDLIRPVGKVLNKRYWLAVSTANSYNDTVYVLDKNMAWTKFSGYTINDILPRGLEGYILDSTEGAIWKAEQGTADRYKSAVSSQAIHSYWQSKDFFLALDRESELEYLYPSFEKTGGDVLVEYAPDFSSSFSSATVDLSGTGVQNDRIAITWGEIAKLWRFKISADNPFSFYGMSIYYKPKELR